MKNKQQNQRNLETYLLNPTLKKILGKHKEHGYILITNQGQGFKNTPKSFKELKKRLKLNHIDYKTLRHTFASQSIMSKIDIFTVSKWLGHSAITITIKYYGHLCPDHSQNEIKKDIEYVNVGVRRERERKDI